jgi:hypothetical protein
VNGENSAASLPPIMPLPLAGRRTLVLPTLRRTVGSLRRTALSTLLCGVLATQLLAMTWMGVTPGGIVDLGDLLLRQWTHLGALRAAFLIDLRRPFLIITRRWTALAPWWWAALAAWRRSVVRFWGRPAISGRGRTVTRAIGAVRIIDTSAKRGGEPRKRKACEYTFHRHTFVKEVPPMASLRPVGVRRQCTDLKPVARAQTGAPSIRNAE